MSSTPPPATPTSTLYPNLVGQFGSVLSVGKTAEFPAALPSNCKLNQAGVFYHQLARTYVVHLDKATTFLLTGKVLQDRLAAETILQDADGSYWMALYQKCVHLGCMVPFRDDCVSFKCPCHGAHYHVDGEYLDGEAPRSMDRFPLAFQGDEVVVDTGRVNDRVPRPESATRLIAVPGRACGL